MDNLVDGPPSLSVQTGQIIVEGAAALEILYRIASQAIMNGRELRLDAPVVIRPAERECRMFETAPPVPSKYSDKG